MMNEYKQTLEDSQNLQQTENGALGYSSTGDELVDLNFTVPARHHNVSSESIAKFRASLKDDPVSTIKWIFYLRDVREGLGERDSFLSFYVILYNYDRELALRVLPLIPEYGRWKDVLDLLEMSRDNTPLADAIYGIVIRQINKDVTDMSQGKSVSLLAKWMPSVNASKKSRRLALRLSRKLGLISMEYRKVLAALRRYIDVTEVKTCGNEWGKIDYNKVSSNANARYLKAFMKHDEERRKKYLAALASPTPIGAVMHASNLYPYEVYSKYSINNRPRNLAWDEPAEVDAGVEALWNNLKDIPTTGGTMVVCDGSDSMNRKLNGTEARALDVARSIGVFFAERTEGEFHNRLIEFSARPQFIDLSGCVTLADKYNEMAQHTDCSNTNLEKVFDLLLVTAVRNKIPQEELPSRLLIISDMEFDKACEFTSGFEGRMYEEMVRHYTTLFQTIKERWDDAGYKMPELVFWNINSRTGTVPIKSNELGVKLVAGFSVNNVKLILSGKTDPKEALMEVLDSERYRAVAEALQLEAE